MGRSSLWGAGLTHGTLATTTPRSKRKVSLQQQSRLSMRHRAEQVSPKLLEGKGKDVRPGGRVMLVLLIDREGVLEWDLEVGGR